MVIQLAIAATMIGTATGTSMRPFVASNPPKIAAKLVASMWTNKLPTKPPFDKLSINNSYSFYGFSPLD
jgi:hypothetical protein